MAKLKISDIMACDVYVDYEFTKPEEREQHKFLVSFFSMKDFFIPDMIEIIIEYDPNGYKVEFKNQKYDIQNINGYILNEAFNSCWYMVNLKTGFMRYLCVSTTQNIHDPISIVRYIHCIYLKLISFTITKFLLKFFLINSKSDSLVNSI